MINLSTLGTHRWDTIMAICIHRILPLLGSRWDKAWYLNIPTINRTNTINSTPTLIPLAPRLVNRCSIHNHTRIRNHGSSYHTHRNTCGRLDTILPLHNHHSTHRVLLRNRSLQARTISLPHKAQATPRSLFRLLVNMVIIQRPTTIHNIPRVHHRRILLTSRHMCTDRYITQTTMDKVTDQ